MRYLTEILAWMGGNHSWSEEMIAEQIDASDGAKVSADLAQAEREGLLERREDGLGLTEPGWRVAEGFVEALQADTEPERSERVSAVAQDAAPGIATNGDALAVRYLAEVLVWIGGNALWPEETVIATVGEDQRARVIRDLELAANTGVIEALTAWPSVAARRRCAFSRSSSPCTSS